MSLLIKPIITEKATNDSEVNNCYTFQVSKSANKVEIKKAVLDGRVPLKRLENAVKKILNTKYEVGLNKYKPISNDNIKYKLNSDQDYALLEKLAEKSMTVI